MFHGNVKSITSFYHMKHSKLIIFDTTVMLGSDVLRTCPFISNRNVSRRFEIRSQPLDGKDHARKRPLTVKSWSTVKDLKDILQSLLHVPAASQVNQEPVSSP